MPAIQTNDLTKRFGDVVAVDGLDLRVREGEVFGFLGPNGAGKSTTIDVLLDYVRPTAGTATVLGLDAHEGSTTLRERIGVFPDGLDLYDRLTGRRHLEFAIEWTDADDDPDAVLDRVGLDRRDAARPVGGYSKGMRQRLALGMALVGDPDLLILDEPSSGLDPHGVRRMRELVREEARNGTTVFFSSHVLGQVEAVCDRVAILADGELVAVDTVEELRETVGAGSELRLRVPGDVDPEVADIAAVDGVDSVRLADGVLRVTCSASRAKAAVVTRLTNAGVDILGSFMGMLFFWKPVVVGIHYAITGSLPGVRADRWYFLLKRLNPLEAYRVLAGAVLDRRVQAVPEFPLEDVPANAPPETFELSNRLAGEVPFYLADWFSVVVLLAWGLGPVVVGYRRFEAADLG